MNAKFLLGLSTFFVSEDEEAPKTLEELERVKGIEPSLHSIYNRRSSETLQIPLPLDFLNESHTVSVRGLSECVISLELLLISVTRDDHCG